MWNVPLIRNYYEVVTRHLHHYLCSFLHSSCFCGFYFPYYLWNFNWMYYPVFINLLILCPVVIGNEESLMLLSCIFILVLFLIEVRIYTNSYCQEVNIVNTNECNIVWILVLWNKTECLLFCIFHSLVLIPLHSYQMFYEGIEVGKNDSALANFTAWAYGKP